MDQPATSQESISPNTNMKKRRGIILQPLFNKQEIQENSENIEYTENQEDITFNKLTKIIFKPRLTLDDIQLVAFFLGKLKELTKFLNLEGPKLEDLLTQIALHLQYEHFNEKKLLFKYGDKGNKFYIILRGYVTIIKPSEVSVQITEDEFIKYLINLRKYNEIRLITSCLNDPQNKLSTYNDPSLILWLKNKEKFDEKIYKLFDEKSDFYKELKSIVEDNKDYNNQNNTISSEEYIERYKLNKLGYSLKKPERSYSIFVYEKVLTLGSGSNFGDSALVKGESNRNATVIVHKDTYLGFMDKFTYESCVQEVNEKIRKKVIDQFLSNKLFYGFNKNMFSSKLLHLFVKKKVYKNELIIKEGEKPKEIFLVMKGEIEIFTKRSLSELDTIVSRQRGSKFNKLQEPKELEKIEKFPKYKKFIKEKMLIKIGISEPGDIFGLEDSILENCYLYSAECASIFAEVFYIDRQVNPDLYKNFFNILSSFNEIKRNYEQFIKSKKLYIQQRLLLLFDSKLKLFNNHNNYNIDSTKNPLLNSISYNSPKSDNKPFNLLSKQVNLMDNDKKSEKTIELKKVMSSNTIGLDKNFSDYGKTIDSIKSSNNKSKDRIRLSAKPIPNMVLDEEIESTKNVSFSNFSLKKYNETKELISNNRIQSSQMKKYKRNPSAGVLIRMSIKNSKEKIRMLLNSACLKDSLNLKSNRNKDHNLESVTTNRMSIPFVDKKTQTKEGFFNNPNVSLKSSCSFSKRRLFDQKTPMPIKIIKEKKIKSQKNLIKNLNKFQTTHLLNIVKINDFPKHIYK